LQLSRISERTPSSEIGELLLLERVLYVCLAVMKRQNFTVSKTNARFWIYDNPWAKHAFRQNPQAKFFQTWAFFLLREMEISGTLLQLPTKKSMAFELDILKGVNRGPKTTVNPLDLTMEYVPQSLVQSVVYNGQEFGPDHIPSDYVRLSFFLQRSVAQIYMADSEMGLNGLLHLIRDAYIAFYKH